MPSLHKAWHISPILTFSALCNVIHFHSTSFSSSSLFFTPSQMSTFRRVLLVRRRYVIIIMEHTWTTPSLTSTSLFCQKNVWTSKFKDAIKLEEYCFRVPRSDFQQLPSSLAYSKPILALGIWRHRIGCARIRKHLNFKLKKQRTEEREKSRYCVACFRHNSSRRLFEIYLLSLHSAHTMNSLVKNENYSQANPFLVISARAGSILY